MKKSKIAILDYGLGNVKSISNAFDNIGVIPILSKDRDVVMESSALVLPGVGAFAKGMENLEKNNLVSIIYDFVKTSKPFLGICLGMQMLLEKSEEFGETEGLGLIKGKVKKMSINGNSLDKLPHVSWNELSEPSQGRWKGTLLNDSSLLTDVYFVHTFVASPENKKDVLATTNYGNTEFCAAVHSKNVYGTQFHPEKSGKAGLKMLKNFIELSK